MKYVKYKNNRFCKIIIFVFIVVFGFSILALKSDNKVKAGVIVSETYEKYSPTNNIVSKSYTQNNLVYIGTRYYDGLEATTTFGLFPAGSGYNNVNYSYLYAIYRGNRGDINGQFLIELQIIVPNQYQSQTGLTNNIQITWYTGKIIEDSGQTYFAIDIAEFYSKLSNDYANFANFYNTMDFEIRGLGTTQFFTRGNYITSVSNLYDVPHNSVVLLYLEDLSGLDPTDYATEATIHWGYIEDANNNNFASYSPTIDIYNDTTNNEINIGLPQNASGSASTYKQIQQNVLFSLGSLYDAETTADIYAIYIYLQEDYISWGYVNFECTQSPPTPSAQSMQFITGSEQVYSFSNSATTQMACRLSISSNLNYITILNQNTFSLDAINAVLRSGGFFPAWSCYNWARGARSGYASGFDAGEAPFQTGGLGYQAIWQDGYIQGQQDSIDTSFLVNLFDSVDSFFSIHLFPFLTIGEIVGIPFIISVVWFIIRQLRGGGGSD